MAGIKNIKDLYKKVGEKGLREVLAKEVRVTEKFDAYRFAFEKNPHNYKIYFYGKNGKAPLTKIDRTVNDLYEAAIEHIENLPADIKKAIPVRHRFGFSWFPSNQPLNTTYDRKPKGGLILTDITIRNRQWEVTNEVTDNQVYDRWAKILKVEANHPIYEGKLDESTIEGLVKMAKTDYSLLNLNESQVYTKGKLNETSCNIEALVIEAGKTLFKLSDNVSEEKREDKRSHLFDILLLDICEHISKYNISSIKTASIHHDESYIEVVSEIFNDFVELKGKDFLESTLERPKFLEKSGKFNNEWIKNPKTLAIIESNSKYEYLFTVFLTNLKKPKYPSGLLSEAVVTAFNSKIEEIDRVVSDDYSFLEFSTIVKESEEPFEIVEADEKLPVDMEKSVYITQSFFGGNRKQLGGKESVNIIICDCDRLTNNIPQEAERLFMLNGKRTILLHDRFSSERNLSIDIETVEKMLDAFVKGNQNYFIGYKILDKPFLSHAYKKLGSEFTTEVISFIGGDTEFKKMERSNIGFLYLKQSPDIKLHHLKGNLYNKFDEALEKDLYTLFCEVTPESVHNFWTVIKSAYNTYTYQ